MYRYVAYVSPVDGKIGKIEVDMNKHLHVYLAVPKQAIILYVSPVYETSLEGRSEPENQPHEGGVAKQVFTVVKEGCGLETVVTLDMTLDPGDISPTRCFGDRLAAIPSQFVVVCVSEPQAL